MGKEWTDEEVAEEIRNAVKIVAEDRLFKGLSDRLGSQANQSGSGTGNTPNPPPSSGSDAPKKRGLWWGDTE